MSDIVVAAAQVAPCFPDEAEMYPVVAAATITAGQLVYMTSAGLADVADGNGSGTTAPIGIALNGAGAGQVVGVLKRGHCYGFALSGPAYWDPLYMSNTAGALGTTAGGTSVICGRVVALSDASATKVFYVQLDWN